MQICNEDSSNICLYEKKEKNKYYRSFKEYHVLTSSLVFMSMLILIFSNDNPIILGSVYIFIISIIICCKEKERFKKVILYFIPVALLLVILNMFFVSAGSTTLFYLFHKRFTLESVIYAVVMTFKLLAVIYLFIILEIMVDSDRAVSYFSSVMPKSTLMLMISFKLVPTMKNRFKSLKEIYEVRGVVFNKKKSKEKTASYVPVLSILLEDSLEGSFDIGEAAYVRGFLSGKRSVYDRQKFCGRDFKIIALSIALIIFYCAAQFKNWVQFNIYDEVTVINFINTGIAIIFTFIIVITLILIFNSEEKKHDIYRN
ncbi:energy-coupling factor transporter transmembrane component T [Clostridium magnum]|uniref:Energy-coupling factor transporter transmembrane protein EcfT n=1 Tax=Clostridium magnum DSM 2767 TaxID=1121326 RepID=A0A161YMW0_9CLOT|nr:energy-coupling factor transporter transmembrane component T [Clostridium magnum]KZL92032.1 energy-coupling factor transporter transmembrane protein EcfT [Clostridium magnum DSM 2767]SHH25228.1 energy-coupling factor transport system permease protein [Clostridium magnum DSM 2767]